jgi:hypothetical protein
MARPNRRHGGGTGMSAAENTRERTFMFLRNGEAEPAEIDWAAGVEGARQAIAEALNAKNVAFVLGAGCSSLVVNKVELGIPTMAPLAKEFCGETLQARANGFHDKLTPAERGAHPCHDADEKSVEVDDEGEAQAWVGAGEDNDLIVRDVVLEALDEQPEECEPAAWRLTLAEVSCLHELGVDLEDGHNRNLERLMEVLFGQRFVFQRRKNAGHWPKLELINSIIKTRPEEHVRQRGGQRHCVDRICGNRNRCVARGSGRNVRNSFIR